MHACNVLGSRQLTSRLTLRGDGLGLTTAGLGLTTAGLEINRMQYILSFVTFYASACQYVIKYTYLLVDLVHVVSEDISLLILQRNLSPLCGSQHYYEKKFALMITRSVSIIVPSK